MRRADHRREGTRRGAVFSYCIGIPPHLSLTPLEDPALGLFHDHRRPGRIENGTSEADS